MTIQPPSDDRLREIYDQYGGDLNKVADHFGMDLTDFITLMGQRLAPAAPIFPRRRVPPSDLGRESLRKHMISARHAESPEWPREDLAKIEHGRRLWEAGTHDMCQGRDRNWFVLYLIPLKRRVAPRKFFRMHE